MKKLSIEFYGSLSPLTCFVAEYPDYAEEAKLMTNWVESMELKADAATQIVTFKVQLTNPLSIGLSLSARYRIGLSAARLSDWGVQVSFSEVQ